MTQQQKKEYWQVFSQFQQSRENMFAPNIQRVLKAQQQEFIEHYRQTKTAKSLLNFGPLHDAIKRMYIVTGVQFGNKVRLSIKQQIKGRMPMGFNQRLQQLIEQYYGIDFLNLSSEIADTTKDILIEVLIDASNRGLGFDDIVDKLSKTELSKNRARLIARTETVAAANTGAMLSAQESGILLNKVWIATIDNRTRHSHTTVTQEAIGMSDTFTVGSSQMLQPGDKGGKDGRLAVPPKEVCNCRCCIAFVPVRDAAGRIISTY